MDEKLARLHIPQQYVAGLINIKELGEASLQKLIAALNGAPATYQYRELVARLAPEMVDMPESALEDILVTLISLYQACVQLDLSTAEITGLVCDAMERSDNEQLRIVGKECETFRHRLIGLLDIESVAYPAKASGIVTNHDHVFVHARALSDIRAIFGSDTEALPKGAAIIHLLNITYQRGMNRENFYVALDTQDVESLIATLQRALSKARGLKKLLEAANVSFVNPE